MILKNTIKKKIGGNHLFRIFPHLIYSLQQLYSSHTSIYNTCHDHMLTYVTLSAVLHIIPIP